MKDKILKLMLEDRHALLLTIAGTGVGSRNTLHSTAKCHENHEIIATENNEDIRGGLMFIADTQ